MLFLKKYPKIFKIKAKNGDVVSFDTNKSQKEILTKIDKDIQTKGKSWNIIIKGRQAGVTTLCQILGLSFVMSEKAFNAYTMAHDATTATDIFEQKIRFAFDSLPENLKSLYKIKKDNTRQLMFDGEMQKATITVGTSARGTTQNYLHISEAGKMSERKQTWDEMVSGTLQASKQAKIIIIESTADGGLGSFYEMVQKAVIGESEFDVIFLSWTDTEEYQAEPPADSSWKLKYATLATRYTLYQDPVSQFGITDNQWYWYYLTAQELGEEVKVQYPFTLEEAFITKSHNKFDVNTVKNLQTIPPIKTVSEVKFFREFQGNQIYSIGIDGSSGLGSDFTGLTVRGYKKIEGKYPIYAQMKAKLQTKQTAFLAINLFKQIENVGGKCFLVPERNSLGDTIVQYLRDYVDSRFIYSELPKPTNKNSKPVRKYGYATTSANRSGSDPYLVDKLANLFENGELEVLNEDERQEMLKFVWNDENRRYEAQEGSHDDLLISDMLAVQGFDFIQKYG